jgi:hypothetical protein
MTLITRQDMSVRKFQVGDVVVASSKISKWYQEQHKVYPGMSGTVLSYCYGGYYNVRFENGAYVTGKASAFEKGTPKTSIEKFEEMIRKAEEKIESTKAFIAETKSKISFMKETDSEVFDENEFKAYHTLTIIEQSDMSIIEKAKAIAALIAGK